MEHRPYDQTIIDPSVEPAPFFADRYAEVAADGVVELRRTLEVIAGLASCRCCSTATPARTAPGSWPRWCSACSGWTGPTWWPTSRSPQRARDWLVGDWLAEHPGRTPTWPAFGHTPPEIMRNFLRDLDETYGSVAGYCRQHLAVDDELIATLRTRYLEYPYRTQSTVDWRSTETTST